MEALPSTTNPEPPPRLVRDRADAAIGRERKSPERDRKDDRGCGGDEGATNARISDPIEPASSTVLTAGLAMPPVAIVEAPRTEATAAWTPSALSAPRTMRVTEDLVRLRVDRTAHENRTRRRFERDL